MRTRISMALVLIAAFLLGPASPTRAQIVPIAPAIVNNVCLNSANDMTVSAYAYDDAGYLLCVTTDENAEGVAIYQESAPGSGQFSLLSGAGGMFFSTDLVGFGVPSSTADALVASVLQQLGS